MIDIETSHPQIPTQFDTDSGTAIPIANVLEILGDGVDISTSGSGNTVTITNSALSNAVLTLSDTSDTTVSPDGAGNIKLEGTSGQIDITSDAGNNKLVFSLAGGGTAIDTNTGDDSVAVSPDSNGNFNWIANTVSNSTHSKPLYFKDSATANAIDCDIQVATERTGAPGDKNDAGLCSFDDTAFAVDANGYVTLTGGLTDTAMANYIVDPSSTKAGYSTIASALSAASSGDTIGIKPGTYTENLTLKAGVDLVSLPGEGNTGQVTIQGKCSASFAGSCCISGIRLQTNSDYCLEVTGSSATVITLDNCFIDAADNSAINSSSTSSSFLLTLTNCRGDIGTTGVNYFAIVAGNIRIRHCTFKNSGGSTTASTLGAGSTAGNLSILNSLLINSITTDGTSSIGAMNCDFFGSIHTLGGTSSSHVAMGCRYENTSIPLVVNTSGKLVIHNCMIDSGGAHGIDGTGVIEYAGLTFKNASSINVSTQNIHKIGPNGEYSGTSHLLVPSGTTAQQPGSPVNGMIRYNSTDGNLEGYSGGAWVDLTGGGGSSPLTTKGDIYTYDTGDARLAIGTNEHTLIADSTAATGNKWGVLQEAGGGTAQSSYTTGDILYASATDTLSKLGIGSIPGDVIIVNDSGSIQWDTDVVVIKDDFLGTGSTSQQSDGWDGQFSATGGSDLIDGTADHPGIFELSVSANSDDAMISRGTTSPNSISPLIVGSGFMRFDFLIQFPTLADGTDDYRAWIGLGKGTAFNTGINGEGIGFEYIRSTSTNWNPFTESSSTQTSASGGSSVAVDTNWTHLRMEINAAATSVQFYIDGTDAGTSTTNIPSGVLSPMLKITKTAGSSERTLLIDAYRFYYKLTNSRWV